jgi:hypothetical protein
MKIKKSRTTGELIPSVIIEFTGGQADYYWTKDQWDDIGGYKGFLKSHSMSILDIKKVHKLLLNPSDFPTTEWEG